ncbi:NF-kappa-B inhibitor delta [Mantella aurantiaca]
MGGFYTRGMLADGKQESLEGLEIRGAFDFLLGMLGIVVLQQLAGWNREICTVVCCSRVTAVKAGSARRSRDCRSFCSPSQTQTVKKLLEQKRQQHNASQTVSAAHSSYLPPFTHDPPWLAPVPFSIAAADTYTGVMGTMGSEQIPQDLEEARLQLQKLSPDQLLQQDEDGDTILHLYAARGLRSLAYAAAEQYLQYDQLNVKEHNGKTPLLVAVAANQPEIVYDLIMLGADVSAADCKGQTALHVAGTYCFSGVLRVFLALPPQKNLDVEARNYDGLTPLHCAVIAQNNAYKNKNSQNTPNALQHETETLLCVQLLLQMGANLTSQEIKSSKTVLHLSIQAGNFPLVKFFLQIRHIDLAAFINMKAHGNTALHMAAALPPNRSTEQLIQRLLFHGGDPSVRNLENDQPAHLVPPGDLSEQIKLLLKKRRVASSTRSQSAASS